MSKLLNVLLTLFVVAQGYHPTLLRNPADVFINRITHDYQIDAPFTPILDTVIGFQPDRLPVMGFGFSNPPPPLGSTTDPGSRTCGLTGPVCIKSRYRTIDGSCNNLARPSWGMPQTPYGRLTPNSYSDGISAMPVSSSGAPLPNPRTISLQLFPDKNLVDPIFNLNAQQWGQIITHDMSLTAGVTQSYKNPVVCCTDGGQFAADAQTNPLCAPIPVPRDDPFLAPQGTQCLNFVRTGTTRDRNCTPQDAPAQQLTTVTGFMDLSLVYGSSTGQATPIRAFQGGRLITILRNGRQWPPQDPNVTLTCDMAQSAQEPCYLAGDIRVNQNPQLTLLQVTLLREHNRIANTLARLNPQWNDEIIFQEARRIHIAEIQHINYYEYLPILLGYENMIKNRLIYPGVVGYVNDYNSDVDPSILNEHATAAFRHFHTLIRGYLQLIIENRELAGAVRLSDWFNRPLLLELGNTFANLARGLTVQPESFSDQYWDSEITQYLFRRNNTFGGDLRATDIQRGRDHGLGTYVEAREACGLPVPKSFHDMTDFISEQNVGILQSLYESPFDVDLVVAGSLENNVPGAQAGPTFLCILTEQFYRTRVGDRYFYENGADRDIAFTPSQLASIKQGASMARLLCDNVDGVTVMQSNAFIQINQANQLVPCNRIPAVDLRLWQDVAIGK